MFIDALLLQDDAAEDSSGRKSSISSKQAAAAASAELWLTRAAKAGHPSAMNNLGILYLGHRGAAYLLYIHMQLVLTIFEYAAIPADPKQSHVWFQRAAEAGNREAMFNLAVQLQEGKVRISLSLSTSTLALIIVLI